MTVAHTLSVISYNIIANPVILAKLQAELAGSQSKSSSRLKWAQLEQLPYLVRIPECLYSPNQSRLLADDVQSAIIQEGFRSVSFQTLCQFLPRQTRLDHSRFTDGGMASRTGFNVYHQTSPYNTGGDRYRVA